MLKNQLTKLLITLCFSSIFYSCSSGEGKDSENTETTSILKTQSEKAKLAVTTARELIGTPYKSGGASKDGIDASGLTKMAWETSGVKLARISREQARQGTKVFTDKVQIGDLVFFSTQKGNNQVSNCGIISKVTNQGFNFIYTSSKEGVKETAYSPYWKDRLVDIRRLGE